MDVPVFSIGDRVLVKDTHENGTIYKVAGTGAEPLFWVDQGLTAHTYTPKRPVVFETPDADGAFNPIGPYTAEQLRPWY